MADRARVTSLEAFAAFRPELIKFADTAQAALTSAGAGSTRVLEWLRREQRPYWKREFRRRQEAMTQARTRMISRSTTIDGSANRIKTDDQMQFDKTKREVAIAEDKARETERWIRVLEKEVEEFRGQIVPLATFVRADLAKAAAALDQMATALEGYTAPGRSAARDGAEKTTETPTAGTEAKPGETA